MNTTDKMAEALRLAHDHIEMDKLLVSHPRDWALIKDALAYEAEAKPAPAPLTNADVVEAWRTTEARRDDYGWTSCEWFQEGVRFAQRHYRVGAAAPAALAALEAEAKPVESVDSTTGVAESHKTDYERLRQELEDTKAALSSLCQSVHKFNMSQAMFPKLTSGTSEPLTEAERKDAARLDWLVNGDGDGPSLILWDQDYKGQPFTTLRACGSINVTGRFDNVRDAIDAAMRGEQGENQP